MFLTWDVGQHDNDEAVVVVEGDVIFVGEPHRVHSSSAHIRQSGVNGEQLSHYSQWVQDDEEVKSGREERGGVLKPGSTHTHTQQTLTHRHIHACVGTHTHAHCSYW